MLRYLIFILFSGVSLGDDKPNTIYRPGEYTIKGMFSKKKGETVGHMTTNFRNGETIIFDVHGMDKNQEFSGIRKMPIKIDERQDTKDLRKKSWLPGAVRVKAKFVDIGEPYKPKMHIVHPSRLPANQ